MVAIVLGNNGLDSQSPCGRLTPPHGHLSGILDRMPELQVLELNNNRLTGPLHAVAEWAEAQRSPFKLVRLALNGNAFEYRAGTVETLVAECGGSGERCSGLPPRSCEAFGQSFELDLKDPNQCQECPFVHVTLLVIGSLFLCSLLAGVVYIALILRHGEATKMWVSTVLIAINHAQTLSIIGLIKLGWPSSAENVMSAIALDVLSLGAARPECLFRALGEAAASRVEGLGGTFFIITMSRMALVAFMLAMLTALKCMIKRCLCWNKGQMTVEEYLDKLEFVETIVFSLQVRYAATDCRHPHTPRIKAPLARQRKTGIGKSCRSLWHAPPRVAVCHHNASFGAADGDLGQGGPRQ